MQNEILWCIMISGLYLQRVVDMSTESDLNTSELVPGWGDVIWEYDVVWLVCFWCCQGLVFDANWLGDKSHVSRAWTWVMRCRTCYWAWPNVTNHMGDYPQSMLRHTAVLVYHWSLDLRCHGCLLHWGTSFTCVYCTGLATLGERSLLAMCLGVWGQVMTKMESAGSDIWAWDPRRGFHTWETQSLARVRVFRKVFSDTWFPYMIWDPAPMIELGVWQFHDLHSIGSRQQRDFTTCTYDYMDSLVSGDMTSC